MEGSVVLVLLATSYAFDDRRRLSEVYQRIGCVVGTGVISERLCVLQVMPAGYRR